MKLVILITEETLLGKFIFTFLLGILFISFGYFFIKKDIKNFIKKTEYRLFNIKWKNETSENINIIRNFLLEHEIELKQETRFETIKTKNTEHKLTAYIKKSIEEVISLEDLLNKSEFYFLETLPLDLSILKIKKIIDIDIEDLLKRKKNKEY